jgi:site-specific recombinase XerD
MPKVPEIGVPGLLAVHVAGFRGALAGRGYSLRTARDHGYVLAQLSRWLAAEQLSPAQLTEPVLERFVKARRRKGYRRWRSRRSLRLLVDYLRREGAIPAAGQPVPDGPLEMLLDAYRRYLVAERRLAPSTVRTRVDVARRFLAPRAAGTGLDLGNLAAADVTGFLLGQARLRAIGSVKPMASPLRCLLRYLFLAGLVPRDLSGAVLAVASPRLASLPEGVAPATVAALLASCDRTRPVGRRDFAILVLMARLGLRAAEVAALRLDDIDWRAGTVVIRGKGGRIDQLPLPFEAGEAVADYLCHGRPASRCRAVFLRCCGPGGPMSGHCVAMVPRSASRRAGVPVVGAHRLRHTAATQMLRHGASLPQVAEVLRHRSADTTAIYAKIDRAALGLVVRPWPGAQR